jgi:hypothetical protein
VAVLSLAFVGDSGVFIDVTGHLVAMDCRMLRTFRAFVLVSVCAWSVAPLVAAPADREALQPLAGSSLRADASYYLWNYYEEPVGLADVSWSADFHLTDGTYLGSQSGSWSGNEAQINFLASAVMGGLSGALGGSIPVEFATTARNWAYGQVSIGAGGSNAWGISALAAGPWIGAAAIGALGLA